MQVVIDIDKEIYNRTKEHTLSLSDFDTIGDAIINGIVFPNTEKLKEKVNKLQTYKMWADDTDNNLLVRLDDVNKILEEVERCR